MMNKAQIVTLFKLGALDEVAAEVLRYGKMVEDTKFTMKEGRYAGENRVTIAIFRSFRWTIEKLNGEVIGICQDPA